MKSCGSSEAPVCPVCAGSVSCTSHDSPFPTHLAQKPGWLGLINLYPCRSETAITLPPFISPVIQKDNRNLQQYSTDSPGKQAEKVQAEEKRKADVAKARQKLVRLHVLPCCSFLPCHPYQVSSPAVALRVTERGAQKPEDEWEEGREIQQEQGLEIVPGTKDQGPKSNDQGTGSRTYTR